MICLTKNEFINDKFIYTSTINLLSDSYLNPEHVLETGLLHCDTIYLSFEEDLVSAIALDKKIKFQKYLNYEFIYLGLTAAKKHSHKGEALNLVLKSLIDWAATVPTNKNLCAISTISTPFSYHYYSHFVKELHPNEMGVISTEIKDVFIDIKNHFFKQETESENLWLLKSYSETRYNDVEKERISSYLSVNPIFLFANEHFNLNQGDRLLVLGIIDKNLLPK